MSIASSSASSWLSSWSLFIASGVIVPAAFVAAAASGVALTTVDEDRANEDNVEAELEEAPAITDDNLRAGLHRDYLRPP